MTDETAEQLREEKKEIIFPAQCECGHIFLEKFIIPESWNSEYRGFAYCGFCQKRRYVK